jgi:hypothetical protein
MILEDHAYVMIEIGCLECQSPSRMVGLYDTVEDAQKATGGTVRWCELPADELEWGGQGMFAVWDIATNELVALGR